MNLITVPKIIKSKTNINIRIKINTKKINFKLTNLLLSCCMIILLTPSIIGHITYSYPLEFKDTLPHGNDFEAMKWISENTCT